MRRGFSSPQIAPIFQRPSRFLATGMTFQSSIPGQTLVNEEWFDVDRTAGSPGSFNSVSGTIKGGMTCGPCSAAHPIRVSGGMTTPLSSELSSNQTYFRGDLLTDNAGSFDKTLTVIYVRWATAGGNLSTFRPFLYYWLGSWGRGISIGTNDRTTFSIGIGDITGAEFDGSNTFVSNIVKDTWVAIGLVFVWNNSGNYDYGGWVRPANGSLTKINSSPINISEAYATSHRLVVAQRLKAFQGGGCGRIACVRKYRISDYNTGMLYPQEIAVPEEQQTEYVINPGIGNNSNVNGPWLDLNGLITALRNGVIKAGSALARFKNSSGNNADYFSFTSGVPSQQYNWFNTYRNNISSYNPTGDRITIYPADYFANQEILTAYWPGLTIQGSDPNNRPQIHSLVLMPNTWNLIAGNKYENASVTGVNYGQILQQTGTDANGRIILSTLGCIRTDTQATAYTELDATPGSYWTSTTRRVIHKIGGGNPTGTNFYILSMGTAGDRVFGIHNGIIKNILWSGGLQWNVDGTMTVHYNVNASGDITDGGFISVVENCEFRHWGKHGSGCTVGPTGGPPAQFLFITNNCSWPLGPAEGSGIHDFSSGNSSGHADFIDAPSLNYNSGTGGVNLHNNPKGRGCSSVVGSSIPTAGTNHWYIGHNNGGVYQFAILGIYNEDADNPAGKFYPGSIAQNAEPKYDVWPHGNAESHTGSTGSQNEASFNFNVTPILKATGIWVVVYSASATSQVTSVTVNGVTIPAVTNGEAVYGGARNVKLFYLGNPSTMPPNNPANVVINRNNNPTVMYAQAVILSAFGPSEIYGLSKLEGDVSNLEQSISDGLSGTNSFRFAVTWSGANSIIGLGTGVNSLALQNIDFGLDVFASVQEINPGAGSRLVGFDTDTGGSGIDQTAALFFCVRVTP